MTELQPQHHADPELPVISTATDKQAKAHKQVQMEAEIAGVKQEPAAHTSNLQHDGFL